MGPPPGAEGFGQLVGLVCGQGAFQKAAGGFSDLVDGLARQIGHDKGVVVDLVDGLLLGDLQQGCGGLLAKLRVDGAQGGMFGHADFIRRQRNQRAARHGDMRHKDRHLAWMRLDGTRDLGCRDHHAAGGVQHDVQRHIRIGQLDGAQHLFGIVHVDIPHHRKAEETHGFLTVNQQDDARIALFFQLHDLPLAGRVQHAAAQQRLQGGKQEQQPDQAGDVKTVHRYPR